MKTNNKTLRYVALIVAALAVTCLCVAVFSRAVPPASAQTTRGTIVYSRAYDGFVNIRKKPSFSAEIVGKFKNGPDGATLLENLGDWVKIDYFGTVGYVLAKHVQRTPTVAFYGNVDGPWLEGIWQGSEASDYAYLFIYDNGTYEWGMEFATEQGRYILQNNEIKFTLVYDENGGNRPFANTLPIHKSSNRLGDYHRIPYTSSDNYGFGSMSKSNFRKLGQTVLREVERRDPRR